MSLGSWKKEFYPTEADSDEAMGDAVGHSLLKWIGLRQENLKRHGVNVSHYGNLVDEHDCFVISGSSCSLCQRHSIGCNHCPLLVIRDTSCASPMSDEKLSPFDEWEMNFNPEPMIYWLEKAKEAGL